MLLHALQRAGQLLSLFSPKNYLAQLVNSADVEEPDLTNQVAPSPLPGTGWQLSWRIWGVGGSEKKPQLALT